MDFAIEQGGNLDLPVLKVTGEIDMANAYLVSAAGRSLPDTPVAVVDLREVAHIDSAGIRAMIEVDDEGRKRGRHTVFLVNSTGSVRRVLDLVRLHEVVEIQEDYRDV